MTDGTPAAMPAAPPATPTGSIYDLGYRRYDGPRLGRAHAIRSLYTHSLRSSFGIGRGGRAKIAPLFLGTLALIPALAIVAAMTLVGRFGISGQVAAQSPIRYDTYFGSISTIIVLFCAAQAPELFGRDQRFGVLSLYFARALRRSDYAVARIAGFATSLLILLLVPQALLLIGRVLLSPDIPRAFLDDLPSLGPVVVQAIVAAALLGGLSMAVSAFSARRAYAVAGIIALFTVPSIVAGTVAAIGTSTVGAWLILLSPTSILDGTNAILFGTPLTSDIAIIFLPDIAYVAAAAIGIVGSIGITIRRFVGITA